MTKRIPLGLAVAAAVCLLGNQADAQFSFMGRGGGGGLGAQMAWLGSEAKVQEEISALDEQKEQLKSIYDKYQKDRRASFSRGGGRGGRGNRGGGGGRNLSQAERNKLIADAAKKSAVADKKLRLQLEEALLPHQYDRLVELGIQALGSAAVSDSYVSAKIKVTDAQKKKMADIRTKSMEKFRELAASARGENGFDLSKFRELQPKMEKIQEEASKSTLAVLTKDQTAALTKLKGKKFDLPERRSRFGRGSRGGRSGGGARKRPTRDRKDR